MDIAHRNLRLEAIAARLDEEEGFSMMLLLLNLRPSS